MTSSNGTQRSGLDGQHVPIAGSEAQTKRVRRGAIVLSLVLVGAGAVFAAMLLTASPSTSAPGQSNTGSGGMPGMNHGAGQKPASTPSPTMASDMPGMDHASADMPVHSPSPTMASDMPGMDHGHADKPATAPTPTMAAEMPGMDHGSADVHGSGTEHGATAEVATDRPLAPVLGTFGGGSSAVMLSAVFLRRKDRARSEAKQAARAARKTQK